MEKKMILLVDDEKAILRILSIKLKLSGYDCISATEGAQALELIESAKPDLMLLDIIMPGVDGFEVLERLRPASQLPVIVFSARPENARKAMSMGANAFIAKPFDVDTLVRRIDSLIGNDGHASQSQD